MNMSGQRWSARLRSSCRVQAIEIEVLEGKTQWWAKAHPTENYRSFTVARAMAESMAVMSQKRVTTCVSVQPLRWKW